MNVLIVDDNKVNLYQLQFILRAKGYEVISASAGQEALNIALENPPDVVVSDVFMPEMDGFSFCREWMKHETLRKVPFIFYTATYSDDKDREFALSLGCAAFLVKPTDPDILQATIESVLAKSCTSNAAITESVSEESGFLRQHNEALVRKLENKMQQLEEVNAALAQDIEERGQAEAALALSERLLRQTEEIGHVGGWEIDIATKQSSWTDVIYKMYDLPVDKQLTYEDALGFCTDESRKTVERALKRAVEYREPFDITIDIISYQGKPRTLRVVGKADLNRGKVIGFDQDITELRQAELEMKRMEAQLQQAQRMESVGRLAGGIAHDFNNMLGVIIGHAEIILEQTDESNPLYEDIIEIRNAANRSAALTRQLLAFARKQSISPIVLDLNATLSEMLMMIRRLIGEGISLVWQPCSELWSVKMDPSQIDQLMTNLCVNARDAIADVGEIIIETSNRSFDASFCRDNPAYRAGDFVKLSVSDNGCGMDNETQARIFEPFYTTKAVGQGTGLGLATVYGILHQNNGFITVYSELGVGSTFHVYLPRYVTEQQVQAPSAPSQTTVRGHGSILLVEDEVSILRLTNKMLNYLGYDVVSASSPAEALKIAAQIDQVDLLITDIIMPEMTGDDLAMQLTKQWPGLRCLFMSGYTTDLVEHRGLSVGHRFMHKPFTLAELSSKVADTIGESAATR